MDVQQEVTAIMPNLCMEERGGGGREAMDMIYLFIYSQVGPGL